MSGNTNPTGQVHESFCNDDRIQILKNKSRELKELTRELRSMVNNKVDELFGAVHLDAEGKDSLEPDSWIEEVLLEISTASEACRDTLNRLSSV